jgi:hypothetical protein
MNIFEVYINFIYSTQYTSIPIMLGQGRENLSVN